MDTILIYRSNLSLRKTSELLDLLVILLFCFLNLDGTVENDLIFCVQTFSAVSWKEQFFITNYELVFVPEYGQ